MANEDAETNRDQHIVRSFMGGSLMQNPVSALVVHANQSSLSSLILILSYLEQMIEYHLKAYEYGQTRR